MPLKPLPKIDDLQNGPVNGEGLEQGVRVAHVQEIGGLRQIEAHGLVLHRMLGDGLQERVEVRGELAAQARGRPLLHLARTLHGHHHIALHLTCGHGNKDTGHTLMGLEQCFKVPGEPHTWRTGHAAWLAT